MTKFAYIVLLSFSLANAQTLQFLTTETENETTICNVYELSSSSPKQLPSSKEVINIKNQILKTVGLSNNTIKLANCPDINNVIAKIVFIKGKESRYIIYDDQWLQDLNNETSSEWTEKFILAHEIGHHLYGHSLNNESSTHKFELEADYFAGRTLSILGASLEETLAITSILPERATSTHPARVDRAKKTEQGWQSAKSKNNKNIPIVDNKNTKHIPIIEN